MDQNYTCNWNISVPTGLLKPTACTEVLWVPLHISRSSHYNRPCSHCAWRSESSSACSGLQFLYLGCQNVRRLILINIVQLAQMACP